jgi:hypothetical protein
MLAPEFAPKKPEALFVGVLMRSAILLENHLVSRLFRDLFISEQSFNEECVEFQIRALEKIAQAYLE